MTTKSESITSYFTSFHSFANFQKNDGLTFADYLHTFLHTTDKTDILQAFLEHNEI